MMEVTKAVIAGDNDQDWVATHLTEDGTLWGVCGDGHGAPRFPERRDFVQHCKDIHWANFFEGVSSGGSTGRTTSVHPGRALEALAEAWGINTIGIGACVTIFRLQNDVLEVWSRGDTMAVFYAGGRQVWQTVRHSAKDVDTQDGRPVASTWQVSVLSPTTMTMVADAHIDLNPRTEGSPFSGVKDECAVYNCLGHNRWAHGDWVYHRHEIDRTLKAKLIVGSDGIWDVLSSEEVLNIDTCPSQHASALANHCAGRWRQQWRYQWLGEVIGEQQYIPNPDDVSCIVVSISA